MDAGRRIYAAQCASCHGAAAQGQPAWDRPGAKGDMPAPPHDHEGHTWKHSDAMLYRIVRDGWRDPYNKTRTLTMPAFAPALTPTEIRQVLDSLKTRWTPEQRKFQREESTNAPYPPEARDPAPKPKQKP
ncbi:MAG: cytochrome c [Pseudomonadota bacterium]|nr:cytochrome c [Pseudomonadota bacterium]